MSQILYIDNTLESQQIFKQICQTLSIPLDIANTIEEAKQKIQQKRYDAYIVNEIHPSALELIEFIRKEKPEAKIAFFNQPKDFSATNYQQLKENYHINYVLSTPLREEEVEALIRQLAGLEETTTASIVEKIPQNLKNAYNQSIYNKLARIEQLVAAVLDQPNQETLTALKQDVHKIAGSAASYGYAKVSDLCRLWESKIAEQLEPSQNQTPPTKEDNLYHRQFARALQIYFQQLNPRYSEIFFTGISPKKKKEETPSLLKKIPETLKNLFSSLFKFEPEAAPSIEEPNVNLYAVTMDRKLIQLLQEVSQEKKIEIVIEKNSLTALKNLRNKKIRPKILMVEQSYTDSPVTGKELLEQIEIKKGIAPTSLVLLIEKNILKERYDALKKGVNFIIKKPLSRENIYNLFSSSLPSYSSKNKFKVLVVDDDIEICRFIDDALTEIDMEVVTSSDETKILDLLGSFHPDLLLIDINMPYYDGWALLKTLRSDIHYQYLSVIIITANDLSQIEKSYIESGDEIINKPLNRKALQTRVSHIAKRKSILESLQDKDLLTGYYNSRAFTSLFSKNVWPAIGNEDYVAVVLMEMDHFDEIRSFMTIEQVDELIISIANILNQQIHEDALRGYLEKGKFGLIFEGQDESQVESLIHTFLLETERTIPLHLNQIKHLTFSCGIAVNNKIDTSPDQLMYSAEDALYKAKVAGGNNIRFYPFLKQKISEASTQEVIIVEDDPDVLQILVHAYESYHFKVTAFENGKAAIDYFNQRTELKGRYLIILDRNLPDMDGIEILRRLKQRFPYQIRAIFLTAYSAEKDVLEGLKEGAVDYITKPFSIPILMQKTNILLNQ